MKRVNLKYLICITIPLVCIALNLWNCKSSNNPVIFQQPKAIENISLEDKEKKQQALDLVNSGNKLYQEKNYKDSLILVNRSILIYPTSEAFYLAGLNNIQEGKNESAMSHFEKAYALDKTNEKVLLSLGLVHTTLGYEVKALENYRNLQSLNPRETLYIYREAILLKTLKDYNLSLERILTIDPNLFANRVELYSQIGDIYLKLKNYPLAKDYLIRAEKESPNQDSLRIKSNSVRISSYLEEGNKYLGDKDYNQAITSYTNAININPNNHSPLIFRAKAYILNKNYLLAEKDLDKSFLLNDETLSIYESYSLLYFAQESYPKSKSWAEKGLKLFPRSPELRNRLGLGEWKSGNTNQAKIEFQRAIEIQPKYIDSEYNLAYLMLEESRFLEAKRIFQSLRDKHPDRKEEFQKSIVYSEQMEFIKRGDDLLTQGKLQESLAQYDLAKSIQPKEPAVWNAYGRVYYAFKDYSKSEANYSMGNQLDPDNLESLLGLLKVYAITSNKSKENLIVTKLDNLTKNSVEYLIALARIKEDRGNLIEAKKDYMEIRKRYPVNESVGIRLGVLYYKLAILKNDEEDFQMALQFLELAKKENPGLQEIVPTQKIIQENLIFAKVIPIIKEANRLYEKKEFNRAIDLYSKAFKESNKPNLLIKIAECHVGMGEDEKAIAILEKSDRENTDGSTDFKEAIYSYLLQKGETNRAERGFLDILNRNPVSYYSYYKLGLIQLERKNYKDALDLFDKALILHYNFPAANTAKGIAYYRKGEINKAKEEFNLATDKDKDFEIAKLNMGILYFNENQEKEARKVFQELTKTMVASDPFLNLSYLEFKSGNIKKAEQNILEALKIERTPANLNAYIRILESKGDMKTKNSIIHELITQHPNSTYAKSLSNKSGNSNISFNRLPKGGYWKSKPLINPVGLLRNYSSSIVFVDLKTKETIWRIQPEEVIEFLSLDWYLLGVGESSVFIWNLENGNVISKIPFKTSKDRIVLNAKLFYYEGREIVGVLTNNRSLDSDKQWFVIDSQGTTQSFSINKLDTVYSILGDDPYSPKFLTASGISNMNKTTPWKEPGNFAGLIQTGETFRADYCSYTNGRIVLKSGENFWETNESNYQELRKLEFANGVSALQITNHGYATIQYNKNNKPNNPKRGLVRYWNKDGSLKDEQSWIGDDEIQTFILSK